MAVDTKYPKQFMKISEMVKLGIPRAELERAVHIPGQTFARRTLGSNHWLIDTVAYHKEMERRCSKR